MSGATARAPAAEGLASAPMPELPELGSSLIDVFVRTAIVYTFLVVAIRLSGKREIGQMSVLELIVILVISDAVQNSMVGENTSIWGGLVAAATLLLADRVASALTARSRRLKHFVEGEPRLLIRDGRILTKAMQEEGVDDEELRAAVRREGIARLDAVQLAVLETDGSISVIPKPDAEAPTAALDPSPLSTTPPTTDDLPTDG